MFIERGKAKLELNISDELWREFEAVAKSSDASRWDNAPWAKAVKEVKRVTADTRLRSLKALDKKALEGVL